MDENFPMKKIATSLPGLLLLEPRVFGDDRGFFLESYNQHTFAELGIPEPFVQDNHSYSEKNVIRGLHYQIRQPQGKLVRVITGDTDNVPYGGGTWASRAAGIGGEAAWQAGKALRANVLAAAASILQADPNALDIRAGIVVDADSGRERMPLDEVARVVYFRPDTLPPGFQAEFMVTRHYVPRAWPFAFTNGVQASYLEIDTTTGAVKLLKHWCVEDCGTVINPQLVNEQIRGGIVQGIGGALYEHCLYDESGQLLNGNLMDYLVPMAGEMPDIDIGHVVTPTADSELGAKGAGEAGTAGAPACIMNAINDALRPLGAAPLVEMPFTPERVLSALGRL
jgi:carbon-monoxide dehydrogenase large subunit